MRWILPQKCLALWLNLRPGSSREATDFFDGSGYTVSNTNRRWAVEIYLDLVMVLNFLVDFFLLLGTNRLSGFPAQPWRCAVCVPVLPCLY